MSNVTAKAGRPITNHTTAKARYLSLKSARDAAAREFAAFEKYCIESGMMEKVKVGETFVAEHYRAKYERNWVK